MYGPFARGKVTRGAAGDYGMLRVGGRYRVQREFVDFDGTAHLVGETWTYLGHGFVPYDDGLSLFVSIDGEREWQIRMQLYPEQQGPIVDRLAEYLAPEPVGPRAP